MYRRIRDRGAHGKSNIKVINAIVAFFYFSLFFLIKLRKVASMNFLTVIQIVLYNSPFYYQSFSFTCFLFIANVSLSWIIYRRKNPFTSLFEIVTVKFKSILYLLALSFWSDVKSSSAYLHVLKIVTKFRHYQAAAPLNCLFLDKVFFCSYTAEEFNVIADKLNTRCRDKRKVSICAIVRMPTLHIAVKNISDDS